MSVQHCKSCIGKSLTIAMILSLEGTNIYDNKLVDENGTIVAVCGPTPMVDACMIEKQAVSVPMGYARVVSSLISTRKPLNCNCSFTRRAY